MTRNPKTPARPDFRLEQQVGGLVAGLDEAGRGPWAGPVMTAAVILDPDRLCPDLLALIDDSKRLDAGAREAVARALREAGPGCRFAVRAAPVAVIDRDNILRATLDAMARALLALPVRPDHALVDGNRLPDLPCAATPVIKGDSRSLSIAAASILAKTTRDLVMTRLARRYPAYAWERNAGYGTAAHQTALARRGVTPHHRRSFKPIAALLADTDS